MVKKPFTKLNKMILKKENLLVQLNVSDLQQLIREAVKSELENITEVFTTRKKDSEEESEIISRIDVCKLLKVSTTTLFLWNKNNILKAKKIGNRVYYFKSDVMDKLKSLA